MVTRTTSPTWKHIKKHPKLRRNCQRNITLFNPPYSKNIESKVGKYFLSFINQHFPKTWQIRSTKSSTETLSNWAKAARAMSKPPSLTNPKLKPTNSENQVMKQNALLIAEIKILAPQMEIVTHTRSFTKQRSTTIIHRRNIHWSHFVYVTQNFNHDMGTTLALSKMNDLKNTTKFSKYMLYCL